MEEYDSEDSDSSEEVDLNQNLSVNKAVDRLNIKTQAQRNKEVVNRAKLQQIKELKEKRKLEKDVERIETLVNQAQSEAQHFKKLNAQQQKQLE